MSDKNYTLTDEIVINSVEINNIENFISKISGAKNLKKSDIRTIHINGNEFISLSREAKNNVNILSEKEFLNIVGANKKRIYKTSGKYQESLFSNYIEAKKEEDNGYIFDVFNKAIIFQRNLNLVKELEKNKRFMKEWKNNFGDIKPSSILKNSGSMRQINIIKDRI